MKPYLPLLALAALSATPAFAQLANLKVVTDASPDYSDMESMTRSIMSNWEKDADKMWAFYYWNHIARRQTSPMNLHGFALTDPIRQFNDYGFMMCSTISGAQCSTWNYLGYPCRYFDIGMHTVSDVWYDGKYHHYDNSLSAYYTLPDGVTVAAVPDIGKTMAGPLSGGKEIPGYIGIYHCMNATSINGFVQGCDMARDIKHVAEDCFKPAYLKYRSYYYDQDRGHRYILNLREGEVYTRYPARQDVKSQNVITYKSGHKADPAYFVPNGKSDAGQPLDPEETNPRYHIRGNGERTWTPLLDEAHLAGALHSSSNIKATANGLVAADASKPAEAIFKVEGANVITSMKIRKEITGDVTIAYSTNNGLEWKSDVKSTGEQGAGELRLISEVNGSYEVLVKVTIQPNASLKSISFNTITEVNGKTQPNLKLGKNTVYVGNGEQTGSIVVWPEMQQGKYKPYLFEESNVQNAENNGYQGTVCVNDASKPGYLVFKVDAPTDITSVTYGGRLYNRASKAHIDFEHSFDGGKTWKQSYSLTDTNPPWDVVHYETVTDVPAGTRSVLFKYVMTSPNGNDNGKSGINFCSIYSTRMEVNHKLAAPIAAGAPDTTLSTPVEVTFKWSEVQKDYSKVQRSHTQVLSKLPATYNINVGGHDLPVVESLTVNLKGARQDVKPGYSDGKDVGGEKWIGKWESYGKNFAEGKPYTFSVEPSGNWEGSDPQHKKLTDGVVGSTYGSGNVYKEGAIFKNNANPEITVDLGKPEKIAAFRIHTLGYEAYDAIKGQNKDKVEVLTSTDGKEFTSQGFFDFNLYWKDIAVNFMWPDEETFQAYNFMFVPKAPVEARYFKYKVTSPRQWDCTEVQALESFELKPFDLKIALPDPANNGKATPKADHSPNMKKWADGEKPTDIGKPQKFN